MLRACLVSLALISASTSLFAQTPAAAPAKPAAPYVYVEPAPPGELVDIGGRRLHIECKGEAQGPVVVFEAGLSQFAAHSGYAKAQELIAPFARVCIYDRAGFGWSDPAAGTRTQQDMVEDLRKLLAAKKLKGPFVLVGHSMGGLYARLYAKQYPADVAAIVLVDATPEAYLYNPGAAEFRKGLVAKIAEGLKSGKDGVPMVPMEPGTPAEIAMAFTPEVFRAMKQEYEAIDLVPEALRKPNGYGTLGDMPLAVIRRDIANPPVAADEGWAELQQSLVGLSTRGFLVVAEKSGHAIPYENPQIVADAVRRVLAQLAESKGGDSPAN